MTKSLRLSLAFLLASTMLAGAARAQEAGVASAVNVDSTTRPPAQEEITLVVGHDVVFDERVKTGEQGQAQLLMLDQSAVTVAANSELVIDKFVYDPDRRTGEMALSLSRGLMRFVGGRLSKQGAVQINTPVATMGVRGGIALFRVIAENIVDVTLIYGEGVTGVTQNGSRFELRRHGYFTRLTDTGASEPQPVPQNELRQALAMLEGRETATAGAPEKPTEVAAVNTLGQETQSAQQTNPTNGGKNANDQEGATNSGAQQVEQDQDAAQNDLQDPNRVVQGNQTPTGTLVPIFDHDISGAALSDRLITVRARVAGVQGQVPGFTAGDRIVLVGADGGELGAVIDGTAALAFQGANGDPDSVPNIFDATDAQSYQSSTTFNANAVQTLGAARAGAITAQNISNDGLFYNTDLTTPDFDGVNGARFTVFGGVGFSTLPTGQSFFDLGGDSRTSSFLPYSDIGRFQLPILGNQPGSTEVIASASVNQTPFIVDWDARKALYIGGVMQNVNSEDTGAETVYGFQAIVAGVTEPVTEDGETSPAGFAGTQGGSTHFTLNESQVRRFHTGTAVGAPLGEPTGAKAVSLDGLHLSLEAEDAAGVRQDPTAVVNHQFGVETTPYALDAPGTGTDVERLFAGVMIINDEDEFERLVTPGASAEEAGTFTIDRDNREISAVFRVRGNFGDNDVFTNMAANSAFFDDDTFAIAEPSLAQGFLTGERPGLTVVSGDPVLAEADRPCECAFMHWGFWAGGQNEPNGVTNSLSDVGFYFAGAPTIDMPVTGVATYVGKAYASVIEAAGVNPRLRTGDFALSTNFQTGVSAGGMNLGAQNFLIVGAHNVGQPELSVNYFQNAQNVGVGHGAFFGPNAENVGVTVNIDNGAGYSAAGGAVGEQR